MTKLRMPLEYPLTRVGDDVEERAGRLVPDPYRWLEREDEETHAWQEAQARLASAYVRDGAHHDAVGESVLRHRASRWSSVPVQAGTGWFRSESVEGIPQVVVADEPYGPARVVVRLVPRRPGDQPPFLSWFAPSPDGATLATGVCVDGSEHNRVELYDTVSGERLPDHIPQVLHDGWVGGIVWLPDSTRFFYLALVGPPADFCQEVFLHTLGAPAATRSENIPLPAGFKEYSLVQVSRDGRWAAVVCDRRTPVALARCDLTQPERTWLPFVTDVDGAVYGHIVGPDYLAVTTVDAPRGRVVAIPLDSTTPNDPRTWREVVPSSNAVIRTITPVADIVYVSEHVDTYSRLRMISVDGAELGEIPLPGRGAIGEEPFPLMHLVSRGHQDRLLFAFSTFTSSWGVYAHDRARNRTEVLETPQRQLHDVVVEDRWATSRDGTRVPYHLIRRSDVVPNPQQPTLIHAYGGFNASLLPVYQTELGVFVEAGGTYVLAHLRGGGEFGSRWWHGGRRERKQNCYDDLYAIAEELIGAGMTSSDALAVSGGSNGGLMSGVAVTQRPDLWRAVVPRVPLLDVVGAFRAPYLAVSSREFGEPDTPAGLDHLLSISPYQLVREGTAYPAVYVDAGAADPRCPPWQARKWVARMQAAQGGPSPVLLHVWEQSGHGWATSLSIDVAQQTDWLAFVMKELGMRPRPVTVGEGQRP